MRWARGIRSRKTLPDGASTDLRTDRAWLEQNGDGTGVGFGPVGWESTTWILHAMYETDTADERTYDERRREAVAAGHDEPLVIGSVNLDERSTLTGVSLGMTTHPELGGDDCGGATLLTAAPSISGLVATRHRRLGSVLEVGR